MQSKRNDSEAPGDLPQPMRYGWSSFEGASAHVHFPALEPMALQPLGPIKRIASVVDANAPQASQTTAFELPKDKTIAISVISGPSKGITHQFHKPCISIGRSGSGTDIEIDDP